MKALQEESRIIKQAIKPRALSSCPLSDEPPRSQRREPAGKVVIWHLNVSLKRRKGRGRGRLHSRLFGTQVRRSFFHLMISSTLKEEEEHRRLSE